MAAPEEVSYKLLKEHDVDYVLVIFGGVLGFGGDDINKFLWMIRISSGIWPDEIQEKNYFSDSGEYRVDAMASRAMRQSVMYKMCYQGFADLFPNGQAVDRVRNQQIDNSHVEPLDYFDEVFTSENWLVRVYKLKDEDPEGRELGDVGLINRHPATFRKNSLKKPELNMRIL